MLKRNRHKKFLFFLAASLSVLLSYSESQATIQVETPEKESIDPLRLFLKDLETGKTQIKYELFHHGKSKRMLYTYTPKARKYYVVKSGDNLTHIARRFKVKLSTLMEMNRIKKANKIYVGQKLLVRKGGSKKRIVSSFSPKKALNRKQKKKI